MRQTGQRGFALLIVLWTLVLLSVLFTQLVVAGRNEARLDGSLRNAASVQAQADGAVYAALFHVLDASRTHWPADGQVHVLRLGNAEARVTLRDLGGRVNPNRASAPLLAAVLHGLGADATQADAVAQAIVDWRSPDAQGEFKAPRYRDAGLPYVPAQSAFQSIDELGLVIGMTPDLLHALAPHLSLFNPDDPDPRLADPVVRQALRDIGIAEGPARVAVLPHAVTITAAVAGTDARFIREADARLDTDPAAPPFTILSWDAPPWP